MYRELVRSKSELEAVLDAPVDHLAYPNGHVEENVDPVACNLAEHAGFRSAGTSRRGIVSAAPLSKIFPPRGEHCRWGSVDSYSSSKKPDFRCSFAREDIMRILVITNMYPSRARPGWGSFIRSQVISLRNAGIEVDVLVINGYRNRWEYLRAIRRMRQKLRETRYDVIHAHYGLSGLVARCQFSVPVVVSFCGDDLYGHAGPQGSRRLTSLPLAWVQRQLSRFVNASIVKSKAMNEMLPGKNAAVIPNGVDMKSFRPSSRQEARIALGLHPDRLYILFPYAPDRPRKNFEALRKAVSRVSQDYPRQPIEIVVISGAPQKRIPIYMNACDLRFFPLTGKVRRTRSRRRLPAT